MRAPAAVAPLAKLIRKFTVALLAPGIVIVVELAHLVGAPLVVIRVMLHVALATPAALAALVAVALQVVLAGTVAGTAVVARASITGTAVPP